MERKPLEEGGAIVAVGSSGITQTNNNVFVKVEMPALDWVQVFFGKRLDQTTFYPDIMGGENCSCW